MGGRRPRRPGLRVKKSKEATSLNNCKPSARAKAGVPAHAGTPAAGAAPRPIGDLLLAKGLEWLSQAAPRPIGDFLK